MHQTEPPTEQTEQEKEMPCITFLLRVVRTLLGYGKHLNETLHTKTDHHRIPTITAAFGTHDVRNILGRIQRGLLRAMMLERFLLARAAQGRDVEPSPPPAEPEYDEDLDLKPHPPSKPRAQAERRARANPNDPRNFYIPTLKELEAQIRRRSIGRTIADICKDLGITPPLCEGAFWNQIHQALMYFSANFAKFHDVQKHRGETLERESDKLPKPWIYDWLDKPREIFFATLGFLVSQPPPHDASQASA